MDAIEKLKYEPLTFDQLKDLAKKRFGLNDLRVISYQDLIKDDMTVNQLFGGKRALILYYPNMRTDDGMYGHFVALSRGHLPNGKKIIYFTDSYGDKPDTQKPEGDPQNLYDERQNTLIKEFLKSGYLIDYNNHNLQSKKDKGIATCGRYALLKNVFHDLSNDQFYELLSYLKKNTGLDFDTVITMLVH